MTLSIVRRSLADRTPAMLVRLRTALLGLLCAVALTACDSVDERAQKHYENGMALLEQGNAVKASLEFRNAIRLNDDHVGANLELGKIYEERKNLSAAIHQFRKVLAIDASQLEAHVKLAQLMLLAGDTDKAVTSTVAAAQLAPDDLEVLILEGTLALRVGEYGKATEKANRALEVDPGSADPYLILAAVARADGEEEKAVELTDRAREVDPKSTRAILFQIDLMSRLGRDEDLGDALRTLVEIDPEEIAFWDALVRWQLRNKKFDEAEASMRRIAELAPADFERQLDIVKVMMATQGIDAGVEELNRLIESAQSDEVRWMLDLAMSDVEVQRGEIDAAETRLTEIVEANPESDAAQIARPALARIKLNRGDTDAALALIDETLKRDSTNDKALTVRGRINIIREDFDQAIEDLRAAEAEAPDNVETLRLLALAHSRNGSKDLARERLAAAVEASDYGIEPVLEYARFLIAEGRADQAEVLLQDAINKRPNEIRLLDMMGRVKLRNRDFTGAERIARMLQTADETKELGDRLMAAALAGQQRYDETIAILEKNREQADEGGDAYLSALVATHLRNEDMEAARNLIEQAMADNPADSTPIRLKATMASIESDFQTAETLFREAVETQPELPINYLALFRFLGQAGRSEEAEEVLVRGIDATDADILRLNYAMMLETSGRVEPAIEQYEVLYERQKGSEVVANNLASLLTDTDPTEEEIERAFNIAKRLRDTKIPHFKDTYGWILKLRGDSASARVALEEALDGLPTNPIVHYHLGMTLADLGETEKAREHLQAAIELAGDRRIPQIAGADEALKALGEPPADTPEPGDGD